MKTAHWTNINVSGGDTAWEVGSFSGNVYAEITGFNSGEDQIDVWLISPAIDMSVQANEELSFKVQASFDNRTILTVYFSSNFTGDPTTADWTSRLDITRCNNSHWAFRRFWRFYGSRPNKYFLFRRHDAFWLFLSGVGP